VSGKKENKNLFELIKKTEIYFKKHRAFKARVVKLNKHRSNSEVYERRTDYLYAAGWILSEAGNALREAGKKLAEILSKVLKTDLSCKVHKNELWIVGDLEEVRKVRKRLKDEEYRHFLDEVISQELFKFGRSGVEVTSDLLISEDEKHRIVNTLWELRTCHSDK